MYTNLEEGNNIAYASAGEEVKKIYFELKKNNKKKEETIKEMVKKINELIRQGKQVSKHCVTKEQYEKVNTIDFKVSNQQVSFITKLVTKSQVNKVISSCDDPNLKKLPKFSFDSKEPVIHVEIDVTK
jgi:Ser-tRNA(Ala) deacylase AlaX